MSKSGHDAAWRIESQFPAVDCMQSSRRRSATQAFQGEYKFFDNSHHYARYGSAYTVRKHSAARFNPNGLYGGLGCRIINVSVDCF
jgi:hypothetical protein